MQDLILTKIRATLEGIPAIKEVYGFPLNGSPKKFPAAIFFFDRFDNTFDTVATNFKILNFKIYLTVNVSGSDVKTVYESVMPKLTDQVIAKFDADWNMGTLEGHRIWCLLTGGNVTLSNEEKSQEVTADLTLQVKLSTEN
jgi:hypothetical protein